MAVCLTDGINYFLIIVLWFDLNQKMKNLIKFPRLIASKENKQINNVMLKNFLLKSCIYSIDIMNKIVWSKAITIKVEMSACDVADWISPLPLYFNAKWHHYVGFYNNFINDFFTSFIPYPQPQQQVTLKIPSNGIVLDGTQIISHLYSLYFCQNNSIIQLQCEFRQTEMLPPIDLMRFYKQNLKASTSIRYGKFGASVITVDMSVNNIQNMYKNLKKNDLGQFLGEIDSTSTKLGFRFIVQNEEKIENVPIRILGKGWRIQRSIKKGTTLQEFWNEAIGNEKIFVPKLHGISLKNLKIKLQKLESYCHPDGYLYFTL